MSFKEAVILAGGKGSRLSSILNGLPKPMVDFDGLPLIHLQIKQLYKYNYKKITILTSYKSNILKNYLNKNLPKDIEIRFYDDPVPLGTAGSFLQSKSFFTDNVLVVYGDTLFDVDLYKFEKFHNSKKNCAVSIFLHPNSHPFDSDLVEVNSKLQVLNFHPYPHKKNFYYRNLVNAALYILNTNFFANLENIKRPCDFAKDIFPFLLKKKMKIYGYISPEYIKDVGTPERYKRALIDFKNKIPQKSNLENKQKAIIIDRDGTINKLRRKNVNHTKELNIFDFTADAIKIFNQNNYKVIILTNQPGVARGDFDISMLRSIHNKLESFLGESGAFVDAIYFCPHHPDSGFEGEVKKLKKNCFCRKPKIGLLKKAFVDFNIDINKSWLIGDSTTDIMTAKNIGIRSILVATGEKGLDYKYSVQPAFYTENLYTAAKFIDYEYPHIYKRLSSLSKIILEQSKKIFFISGYSKTGKTTYANILKDLLANEKEQCNVISLDRWILPKGSRGDGVLHRYDIDAILDFIKMFNKQKIKSKVYSLPNYNKKLNRPLGSREKVKISKNDFLIFEGVVAGYIANKLNAHGNHLFISREELHRRDSIQIDYLSRGYNMKKINSMLKSREIEELTFIDQFKNIANFNLKN